MNYNLFTSNKEIISLNKSQSLIGHLNKINSFGKIVLDQINNGVYNFLNTKTWGTVLDIGANVGLFSFFISNKAEKIYAVEPSQEHYVVLTSAIEELNIKNVNTFNLAIGTFDGETTFFLNYENSTMNSLLNTYEKTSYKQKTNVNTILNFILSNNLDCVDLVKMDIEGAEMDIVQHSSFKEATKYINNIYIEAHDFQNNGKFLKENSDIIENILKDCGYKTTRIMVDGIFGEK